MTDLPEVRYSDVLSAYWVGNRWRLEGEDVDNIFWEEGNPDPAPTLAEVEARVEDTRWLVYRRRLKATPRQFRIALHRAGLLTQAQAIIDQSGNVEAQITWDYAIEIERLSPMIEQFAAYLNPAPTPEEIDAIFEAAMQIPA